MARIIPALWFSAVLAGATPAVPLHRLAKAYRESPSPAKRLALERYARGHARERSGALARLALGVTEYEQGDAGRALEDLKAARPRLAALADYIGYYAASAAIAAADYPGAIRALDEVGSAAAGSPLVSPMLLLRGQALVQTQAAGEALRLLRERYAELAQPDGDLALGNAAQAAGDEQHAAVYFQQVYFGYPGTDAAGKAAASLQNLSAAMGDRYPQPSAEMRLARASKLIAQRDYSRARAEFGALGEGLDAAQRDRAQVGLGTAQYLDGDAAGARQLLNSFEASDPEMEAERLYALVECARRLGDDQEMLATLERLEGRYPRSGWRLRGLVAAANRFLLINRPDQYEPLYRAAYQAFPGEARAAYCHWKVAWAAYLQRRGEAGALLREQLEMFSAHPSGSAALYFLGRLGENNGDFAAAHAWYRKLVEVYPNYYYGVMGRLRLKEPEVARTRPSETITAYLRRIAFPARPEIDRESTAATKVRLERARLLDEAGLSDQAERELRFGARRDGQPWLLAFEMARYDVAPHQRLRYLKGTVPGYLALPLEDAPRGFWEALFPMPYRDALLRSARQRNLDPYLIAGLIRQESEFNPDAVSGARAYGLTQVLPATGRQIARKAGLRHFSTRMLFQPSTNLRLGAYYLRSMLDQWGGKWEETLASYNAGKTRVNDWITWAQYREPAEFIETIPFTETREYVQSVLRNAAIYRELYGTARADGHPRRGPATGSKKATVRRGSKRR